MLLVHDGVGLWPTPPLTARSAEPKALSVPMLAASEAASRPLLTIMASGRNDCYQAISCHPGYFKSERQLSLLPAGRIRPKAEIARLINQTCRNV